jgi:hypothetical protein
MKYFGEVPPPLAFSLSRYDLKELRRCNFIGGRGDRIGREESSHFARAAEPIGN